MRSLLDTVLHEKFLFFDFVSLDLWHEVLIKILFHLFCFIYYVWLHFKQRCYFLCCREKELAAVKIKAADVDIIANELEVSASYFNQCSFNMYVFWLPKFKRLTICFFQYWEQLDPKVAERTLREHKGDAVAAIRHLLR